MDLKSILTHAASLPVADRVALIDELWLTMPEEDDALFDAADLPEWKRRSDELEANPEMGLSWDQVKAQLKLPTI